MAEEKKRILIISHALELGGAERSLIGLLDAVDPDRCQVDLFLLRQEGELLAEIPDYVRLLPEIPAYTVLARPAVQTLKEGHFLLTAARLIAKLAAKRYVKQHSYGVDDVELEYSHKFTCPFMPQIQPDVEYDLTISFLTPHYFAARKVRTKKKIAWVHTDYSKLQIDVPSETAMWSVYDNIVAVSDSAAGEFFQVFPTLKDRGLIMENILSSRLIREQADAFDTKMEIKAEGICLLSVGRYRKVKNFDNIPDICSRLLGMGLNVTWYLIGYGRDEALIRRKITEFDVEGHVVLLGKRENPYPYIKACDLYVQPSRYEGKCVAVREAQILGKPVAITEFPTSGSQLEDGVDGVIVPMDNAGCAKGIAELLRDPEKMERLRVACRSRDYANQGEIEKLYQMIEKREVL